MEDICNRLKYSYMQPYGNLHKYLTGNGHKTHLLKVHTFTTVYKTATESDKYTLAHRDLHNLHNIFKNLHF